MDTVWRFTYEHDRELPEAIDSDVRMPLALAERLVERYTEPGDTVLDPFAGFGTTLRVADGRDRRAYGVEYEPDHV
jgi:DNA modification methylase